MLHLTRHANGVETLQSPLLSDLGVTHAFSTRVGGVSPPPFDTLNLGSLAKSTAIDDPGGDLDHNAHVAENYRRFREAIGANRLIRTAVGQVHGRDVWQPPTGAIKPEDVPEADAIVGGDPRQLLIIRTADCLPVLFATPDGRHVAAAHAGWRGLVAGVLPATVETLCERSGAKPQDLVAAIGPGIGVDSYEVGPEVANAFHEAGLVSAVRLDLGDRPHVDLRAAAILYLDEAGLTTDCIDTTDACTCRDAERFFSYRREGKRSGRQASAIAARG